MIDERIGEMAARLHSSSVRLQRLARREDEDDSVTGPRLSALSTIAMAGPISLSDLATSEQVRAPTMSRVVDQLVAAGLVTRELDPADRRMVRIAITKLGLHQLDQGRARHVSALAARLGRLADSERRALYRGVELMERLLV